VRREALDLIVHPQDAFGTRHARILATRAEK
jgi:hypothetical protein